jgi:broad specificity phosphatase PhoE
VATIEQRLFLLRHGESQTVTTDGRLRSAGDMPLTERGAAVARSLAPLFAPLELGRIHTSDQLRAVQTAQGVGGDGIEIVRHAALREISLGAGEGRDAAAEFAAAPGFLYDPDVALPGGETPRQVRARAAAEVGEILNREGDAQPVVIVGHGCLNRMLLSHLLGLEISRALRIRQDWGAVNVLERRGGEWRLGALNFNVGGLREFALTRQVTGVRPEVWQRLGQ